tara:strand:+ start:287 stop:463 length:177 start_codon:yes stop_codon:yes gene_type:complete
MKKYKVEYWYLHFIGNDDTGYDYDVVEVEAENENDAIEEARLIAPRYAKKFKIIEKKH